MALAHPHPGVTDVPFRFGADYREQVTLRDGRVAELFMFGREHASHLVRAFGRMSPESRYKRFMSMRSALSERQLAYLTATDGLRHVALAAAIRGPGSCEEAALARFVQVPGDPEVIEAAITVVDDYQRLGLGALLMERLLDAARERGYRRLRAELLGDNRAALSLLRRARQPVSLRRDANVIIAELDLVPRNAVSVPVPA